MEEFTMYENRVIAFIDILGFKKMVENHPAEHIFDILNIPKNYFKNKNRENLNVSTFSDSIIMSFIMNQEHAVYEMLLDLQNILIEYIKKNVLLPSETSLSCGNLFDQMKFLRNIFS
jgi:hypothetical protein